MVGSFTLCDVKLEKHFRGSLPIEGIDWQVGAIIGRSGSGKTSIAKQLFPDAYIRGFEYKPKRISGGRSKICLKNWGYPIE